MVFQYVRTATGEFKCPHCNFTKANQSTVHMHIRAKHSGTFKHKCEHCTYETAVKQNLDNHVNVKHPEHTTPKEKEFECPGCPFESMTKAGLRSHYILKHLTKELNTFLGKTEKGEIQCTSCGDLFKSKPSFVYHMAGCLPEEVKARNECRIGLGLVAAN